MIVTLFYMEINITWV